jgi:hypothetical protein
MERNVSNVEGWFTSIQFAHSSRCVSYARSKTVHLPSVWQGANPKSYKDMDLQDTIFSCLEVKHGEAQVRTTDSLMAMICFKSNHVSLEDLEEKPKDLMDVKRYW